MAEGKTEGSGRRQQQKSAGEWTNEPTCGTALLDVFIGKGGHPPTHTHHPHTHKHQRDDM